MKGSLGAMAPVNVYAATVPYIWVSIHMGVDTYGCAYIWVCIYLPCPLALSFCCSWGHHIDHIFMAYPKGRSSITTPLREACACFLWHWGPLVAGHCAPWIIWCQGQAPIRVSLAGVMRPALDVRDHYYYPGHPLFGYYRVLVN